MFLRILIVMILFTGQLLSSDQKPEKESQQKINPVIKNLVISAVVGVAVLFSHEVAYLKKGPNPEQLCFFDGEIFESVPLTVACRNFKYIPCRLVNEGIILLKNGQRICDLVAIVNGCCASAICHYGLNRFFPG
jgi:hypothetical protein